MNELVLLLICALMMFLSHEIVHYLSLILMEVKIKTFYISKKGIGFTVDNQYMKEDKKLLFFFLFPLVLSLAFLIDPDSKLLVFFSVLNLLWSLSDIGTISKIKKLPSERRVDWADKWDKESLKKSIYRVDIEN